MRKHSPIHNTNNMQKKILKNMQEKREPRMSKREDTTCESLFENSQQINTSKYLIISKHYCVLLFVCEIL